MGNFQCLVPRSHQHLPRHWSDRIACVILGVICRSLHLSQPLLPLPLRHQWMMTMIGQWTPQLFKRQCWARLALHHCPSRSPPSTSKLRVGTYNITSFFCLFLCNANVSALPLSPSAVAPPSPISVPAPPAAEAIPPTPSTTRKVFAGLCPEWLEASAQALLGVVALHRAAFKVLTRAIAVCM